MIVIMQAADVGRTTGTHHIAGGAPGSAAGAGTYVWCAMAVLWQALWEQR